MKCLFTQEAIPHVGHRKSNPSLDAPFLAVPTTAEVAEEPLLFAQTESLVMQSQTGRRCRWRDSLWEHEGRWFRETGQEPTEVNHLHKTRDIY